MIVTIAIQDILHSRQSPQLKTLHVLQNCFKYHRTLMGFGREFHQVGARIKKDSSLVKDSWISLGPGINSRFFPAKHNSLLGTYQGRWFQRYVGLRPLTALKVNNKTLNLTWHSIGINKYKVYLFYSNLDSLTKPILPVLKLSWVNSVSIWIGNHQDIPKLWPRGRWWQSSSGSLLPWQHFPSHKQTIVI